MAALVIALEIVRPGLLTTVQDLGRPGRARFGVSPSGAMDPLALRAANRLLGNEDAAAALEITGPGVELLFHGQLSFAVAGGDLGATLAGAPVAPLTTATAAAGQTLSFGRRVRGARVVLAVAGGLVAPRAFGSAATDLDAGLGAGRLPRGHRLEAYGGVAPRAGDPRAALLSAYDDPFTLRFVPEDGGGVPADAAAAFRAGSFTVSDRSNRTGYRLRPFAPLPRVVDARRLSEPTAPGAIQLPPDGEPILLMADRQTTGGYPRLGHLIAADRPRAAQLWPGDVVRFVATTVAEAHAAFRAQEAALVLL